MYIPSISISSGLDRVGGNKAYHDTVRLHIGGFHKQTQQRRFATVLGAVPKPEGQDQDLPESLYGPGRKEEQLCRSGLRQHTCSRPWWTRNDVSDRMTIRNRSFVYPTRLAPVGLNSRAEDSILRKDDSASASGGCPLSATRSQVATSSNAAGVPDPLDCHVDKIGSTSSAICILPVRWQILSLASPLNGELIAGRRSIRGSGEYV